MLVILLFIMIYLFNVNATNINRNPSTSTNIGIQILLHNFYSKLLDSHVFLQTAHVSSSEDLVTFF